MDMTAHLSGTDDEQYDASVVRPGVLHVPCGSSAHPIEVALDDQGETLAVASTHGLAEQVALTFGGSPPPCHRIARWLAQVEIPGFVWDWFHTNDSRSVSLPVVVTALLLSPVDPLNEPEPSFLGSAWLLNLSTAARFQTFNGPWTSSAAVWAAQPDIRFEGERDDHQWSVAWDRPVSDNCRQWWTGRGFSPTAAFTLWSALSGGQDGGQVDASTGPVGASTDPGAQWDDQPRRERTEQP